ncbi:hypothetical protein [Acinetobacter piscicola]|uniref:hypothetical protein n=1 Tax=Acinetobacter piscicola TaxID=2006115 RepID=UPI001022337B|nr:hypothetical protein [Acinetobacter piscicola]RYL29488.1 hypothetical protein EWP19_01490 [Acinetobacter piscicola]
MRYSEIIDLIKNSENSDWLHVPQTETFVYKSDVNLTFRRSAEPREEFQENWIPTYQNPKSYSVSYELFYNRSPLYHVTFVEVDGQRCALPLPSGDPKLFVYAFDHKLASLIDKQNVFEDYFEKTQLPVLEK